MALGDFFRKQFIDVIHWTEPENGVLVYRFPMADMEIQNGAQLTVREGQAAVFVNEGQVADVFRPGRYTLSTQTLPLLTNLMNWDKLFQSPFKSDVYFISTRVQTAQRWGTQNPVTVRDKDFGMVRLRAFGMYSWHVDDPVTFVKTMSGTRELYRVPDLEPHLRNLVVSKMSEAFAQSGVPFLDMAASTATVGSAIAERLRPAFEELAKGQILGDETGMLKLLFDPDSLVLLGAHAIGEGATELMHIGQAVLALGGTIEYFRDTVFNYPTLAEAYKVAALAGINRL